MTHTTARTRRHNLYATLPIVLAGTMAITGAIVVPPTQAPAKGNHKPRTSPIELGKTIREAFTAARTPTVASTDTSSTVSESQTDVAALPSTYKVAPGDTISSIAGRYGLATASVLALNGLGWKSVIFPGQVLRLSQGGATPVASPAVPSTSSSRYTIVKGDTIGHIAAKFGLSTATILSANGLSASSIIYPGHTLAIPGSTTAASTGGEKTIAIAPVAAITPISATSYTIGKGDSIAGIAAKFGVSTQALLTANGLGWSSIIYPGRTLTVPVAASATSSASPSFTPSSALTGEMKTNARTIISVGRSLGVPAYGIVIALAAAAQESGLRNLNYGDRDSLGLFQQRPSTGWGTRAQILDPTYSARLFYGGSSNPNAGNTRGLLDIPNWQIKTVTQAAQAVQLSAYPDAYAKWETAARTWYTTLG